MFLGLARLVLDSAVLVLVLPPGGGRGGTGWFSISAGAGSRPAAACGSRPATASDFGRCRF